MYLKEKTGMDYEIPVIQEAAARGSILSLDSDMTYHNRADEIPNVVQSLLDYKIKKEKLKMETNLFQLRN